MRLTASLCLLAGLLALAGCQGAFDPYQRPGQWSATGASNATIAQQVADPADLIQGRSDNLASGVAATAAIDTALGANGAGTAAGLHTPATDVVASTGD